MKLVIFDMDGVILRGHEPLPHAAESVLWLRENGFEVTFLTNNSTQVPLVFAERLQKAGIETSEENIMTSSLATAVYLDEKTEGCRNAYVVGEDGIKKALESKGFRIVNDEPDVHARYVVVGMDRQFNYEKLWRAQQEILYNGAELIATNYDPIFPVEDRRVKPGGGILVRAIEASTGKNARIIGKPSTTSIIQLMKKFGTRPGETVMVGDNLDTDILAGKNAGIITVFVLTGIHTQDDLLKRRKNAAPDFVIKDLSALKDCLKDT